MFFEQPDGVHGAGEGTLLIAEIVVGFGLGAVETERHHFDLGRLDLLADGIIYQRAVGGQTHAEAFVRTVPGDIEDIVAEQRFAAGKHQHRTGVGGDVVDDRLGLGRGKNRDGRRLPAPKKSGSARI